MITSLKLLPLCNISDEYSYPTPRSFLSAAGVATENVEGINV